MVLLAEKYIYMVSIFAFGFLCIFFEFCMSLSLNSYVKATTNMKTTKKKILINLRDQFETIYGMNYQVRNTYAYVDKYLLKMKFMGISYNTWERLPFMAAGILTILIIGEAFYAYVLNEKNHVFVEILFSYAVTMAFFYLFYHIFRVRYKKEQMQIQLVDYLENYLSNRLLKSKEKEVKVLNASMEDAFMDEELENERIRTEILKQEETEAKMVASQIAATEMKEEILPNSIKEKGLDEKLANAENLNKEPQNEQDENLALLEDFVQSFLS